MSKRIHKSSIVQFGNKKIERLNLSQKFGDARAIETSMNSLLRFAKYTDVVFAEIDQSYLKDFCAYCYSRGKTPNTISAYLRPIKTLFNEAIQEGIVRPELNPFVQFKIPKSPKTKKRSLIPLLT